MLTTTILALAGFGAGALNAIAGGGTFLTFPALVWVGVPPIMANATATFAALPGYAGSSWAYRRDIQAGDGPSLRALVFAAMLGGTLGALLLLITPEDLFSGVVPWLLLIATLAFAAGPALLRGLLASGRRLPDAVSLALLLLVSIYGGYFNGGLGIMLLAALGLIGMSDLHSMNGLKTLVSLVLSAVSVVTYSLAGLIDWSALIVTGLGCTAGGYFGAHLARRVQDPSLLRAFIVTIGLVTSIVFFAQAYS
ncbi:sulfite exporter TauE/SafE family protein [Salipiger bermudensis]|uniref:sulfite exporter TauE/SafE family protein n=1 Tax=Salipiger TaxID=263377 RepID=UPI001CD527C9|nr:sulfite exporter TauE/SafE family protein [Salipiger bermudensis]MBR9892032.1 sulfite exporter TauE/SafE family protein [bacterium]MCA1288076.1 sulfite exporter TauE/SafE family protein [Salipiger bermudensis]